MKEHNQHIAVGNPEKMLSRRDLLKASAVLGGGVVAAGLLGCGSPSASASEPTWTEETDFAVCGGGGGIFAAAAAKKAGKQVIVLEKGVTYGGTTFTSEGGAWVPGHHLRTPEELELDAPEKVMEYLKGCDYPFPGVMNEAVTEDFVKNVGPVFKWITETLGVPFSYRLDINDYLDFPGTGNGRVLIVAWKTAREVLDTYGLDVRTGTPATRLITDETGAVLGVAAGSGDEEILIKARSGVLLAMGGFDHNETMRKAYLRSDLFGSVMVPECTGDGIQMGIDLGADISHMSTIFGNNVYITSDDGTFSKAMDYVAFRSKPNSIIVNKLGMRFVNESSSYETVPAAMSNTITSAGSPMTNNPSVFIFDSAFVKNYGFPLAGDDGAKPEWIRQYDTVEALAAGEGVNPERLAEEVARFNGFCADGVDRDWHRGEGANERQGGLASSAFVVPTLVNRPELKNQLLGPIAVAPFYAAGIALGSFGTSGGLMVNENAQVLKNGEPIPGLYAAGCTAASYVSSYVGAGLAVASTIYRSVAAANHALDLGVM